MIRLILALVLTLSWPCFGQGFFGIGRNVDFTEKSSTRVFKTGTADPSAGDCNASGEVGRIYLQTGNPASVVGQTWACMQTGASSYGWQPVGFASGTTPPAACAAGQLFFDTDATAGSNLLGCTASGVWTALGAPSETNMVMANPFTEANAVPVSAANSGRATVQSPVHIDATTGAITNDSTDPSLYILLDHTTNPGAPGAGLTGLYTLGGVPKFRAGAAGAAKTLASTDQLTANPVTAASTMPAGAMVVGDDAGRGVEASVLNGGVLKITSGIPALVTGGASDCVKVDGSSGACGGGAATFPRTTVTVDDDILVSHMAYNTFGLLGWKAIGDTQYDDGGTGQVFDHPGTFSTYALAADKYGIIRPSEAGPNINFGNLGGNTGWDSYFVFRTNQYGITQQHIRIGFMKSDNTGILPTDGVWARWGNTTGCTADLTDATWIYETRASSTSSVGAGPASPSENSWYTARIRSTTAGTILFSLAAGTGAFSTEVSLATNVPTASMVPFLESVSCGENRKITLDRFYWQATVAR